MLVGFKKCVERQVHRAHATCAGYTVRGAHKLHINCYKVLKATSSLKSKESVLPQLPAVTNHPALLVVMKRMVHTPLAQPSKLIRLDIAQ